jgi:methionine synthase II (cobalamin-independent)
VAGKPVEEVFMTAISPSNLELYYENRYYASDEEYLAALADAMRVEYKAIVDAGFLLQIDDPRMATHFNRAVNATVEECRKFIALRVETVNYALHGIPQDRVRFHTCYSVNVAPRVYDFELKHFADLMLKINAMAYLIEGANPRHEHEWELWQHVKLPDDKILVPGVVSHCVHLVEHPELVAQRIVRLANVVGRERVIAGTARSSQDARHNWSRYRSRPEEGLCRRVSRPPARLSTRVRGAGSRLRATAPWPSRSGRSKRFSESRYHVYAVPRNCPSRRGYGPC